MSTQFTPRTDAERAQWRLMCEAVTSRYIRPPAATLDEAFDAIVAPVPRVLREYKGVAFRDGYWWTRDGYYATAFDLLSCDRSEIRTDDDHAAIYALKADPYEPTPAEPALTRQQCVEALVAMGAYVVSGVQNPSPIDLSDDECAIILPREVTP